MLQRIEVHLHIHEGASPATVEAAVKAALGSANGTVATVDDDEADAEKIRDYWKRSYEESAMDSEGKARPLLKFLASNPERLIPFPEVSQALGFSNARSLPGLLGAFGRRAEHRYRGVWPFERKLADGEWHLWMSQEAAEVIRPLF